jgi:hypothetical protein
MLLSIEINGLLFCSELHLLPQEEQKQSRMGSSATATEASMIALIQT